jgi:hypothetical protein
MYRAGRKDYRTRQIPSLKFAPTNVSSKSVVQHYKL